MIVCNHFFSLRYLSIIGALVSVAAWLGLPSQAEAAPAWRLTVSSMPTNFKAGANPTGFPFGTAALGRNPQYNIVATNVGNAPTSGVVTITDTLPPELKPESPTVSAKWRDPDDFSGVTECEVDEQTVTCTIPTTVRVERFIQVAIPVEVDALAPPTVTNKATIKGGGAQPVVAATTTTIAEANAPFDFLAGNEGLSLAASKIDGTVETQASGHPYRLGAELGFASLRNLGGAIEKTASLKDLRVDLPPGLIVNPQASRELCTELELQNSSCPLESQVGIVTVSALLGGGPTPIAASLYNMVAPPGVPGLLGFEGGGVGIFIHVEGKVRSASDYGLSAISDNTYGQRHFLRVQTSLWGDSSDPSHDDRRGDCGRNEGSLLPCFGGFPLAPQDVALVTLPSDCNGANAVAAKADTWEEPGAFREANAELADLVGNPKEVNGCDALDFKPTIESTPTTNLVDSPSGLNFTLHQPQNFDPDGVSTPALKDAVVTLPTGMSVNPASASSQQVCSTFQVGLTTPIGSTPIHFDEEADACPDASKIGTVGVSTPALDHVVPGAVYLAEPFQNPFKSFLAIYISVNDPVTGIVATLAGEVKADPNTGQLTTTFTENPQLPLEDIDLHIFEDGSAPLITPPTCGSYSTTSTLTPWSAPETPNATPSDSFAMVGAPGGGTCPTTGAQAPNSPAFSAGTVTPKAGAYSPFVLKLSREDGSQRLKGVSTTLAPGLSGKLAGIPVCSEAAIAVAESRVGFDEGAIEQASPSCPAASQLGTVTVAAGAGGQPYYTQGKAYLAGPYGKAPVSAVIITPAVAGPFDLGVVTVRAALNVNPVTAQITAVSDPVPTILKGIPLDIRSATVEMNRPEFTLNPTSCDEMAITGQAISVFEQAAPLFSRFQVGGCKSLPYKPKLSLRLFGGVKRGDHPRLRGVLTAKPGEANTARATVALPRSEFLDQSHIRTVCTRVQFAANQCPKGAIYGHVRAITPLLDEPLEGPVYLRSSDNELPDAVGVLKGPPSRPIQIEVSARIDSINGGIRANFETTPDAPISKVIVTMQGGKKGLLINSTNLCLKRNRATVKMDGHNGKVHDINPVVRAQCKGKGKRRRAR